MILVIWAGIGEASMTIPAGKVGIKTGGKIAGESAAIVGGAIADDRWDQLVQDSKV